MTGDSEEDISSRVLTVPNLLSFIRLGLVPVFLAFILLGLDVLALLTLVVSSLTDFLDGAIARRFRQVTRLGQILDPAADRLFIFATLIGLGVREIVPWWFVAAIVGRDVMLLVIGVVLANAGWGPLPVHHLGKIATFCLFYALPIIMLGLAFPPLSIVTAPLGWAFALWGGFLYWWAGIIYVLETNRLIRNMRIVGTPQSDTLDS